jgi:hypothetical protein
MRRKNLKKVSKDVSSTVRSSEVPVPLAVAVPDPLSVPALDLQGDDEKLEEKLQERENVEPNKPVIKMERDCNELFDPCTKEPISNFLELMKRVREIKKANDTTPFGLYGLTNNTTNYIIGNGAVQLTNSTSNNSNSATQYIKNYSVIPTSVNNGITISIWFNASNLTNNNLYTLFDIASTVDGKGIQLDLSGTNMIFSGLYY